MMQQASAQWLTGGRLHLQHGPIDLVLKAWGGHAALRLAYEAAEARFAGLLSELVAELRELKKPIADGPAATGAVARRMIAACRPFADGFITPMAAVAGAVADELLAVMTAAAPLSRAFVNDGGDIAIHLAPGQSMEIGMAGEPARIVPALGGRVTLRAGDGIGGVATSGRGGRSFSLGIADSVTVLARSAAEADAAATLIANAVNIDSPAIARAPAYSLDPDSDLGALAVTVDVGPLTPVQIAAALHAGKQRAEAFRQRGLITACAMTLRGCTVVVGEAGQNQIAFEEAHS